MVLWWEQVKDDPEKSDPQGNDMFETIKHGGMDKRGHINPLSNQHLYRSWPLCL